MVRGQWASLQRSLAVTHNREDFRSSSHGTDDFRTVLDVLCAVQDGFRYFFGCYPVLADFVSILLDQSDIFLNGDGLLLDGF